MSQAGEGQGGAAAGVGGVRVVAVPVGAIDPDPSQPRQEWDRDALERLAQSLLRHGQIQPITLRPGSKPGRFTVLAGERRLRASAMAGRETVDAVILTEPFSDEQRLELQIVENELREGLSPLDRARAFRTLMDRHGWSAKRLAASVKVHTSTVTRALRLLDLPDDVRDRVADGRLAPSVAHEVSRGAAPDRQAALAGRVEAEGLSRSDLRRERRAAASQEADDPGRPSGGRRVFETGVGRVTVDLYNELTRDRLVVAIVQCAEILRDEGLEAMGAVDDDPADEPPRGRAGGCPRPAGPPPRFL